MTDVANEDCIVCMEKNLVQIKDGTYNYCRLTCCGASFCKSCDYKMMKTSLETRIEFTCPICRSIPVKNDKEDFDRAMKHAKAGRPWALDKIGMCYNFGKGVTQSDTKAFEFYSLAAAKGYATSQYALGNCYRKGKGCKQSSEQAFRFFYLAAAQGMPVAQNNVGNCYSDGYGVEKSSERAFEWYSRALENGSIESQYNVGRCYYNGWGVETDYEKAVHFYTFAANQGHKKAQFNLVVCYANGEGVKRSFVKAICWSRQCLKDNTDEIVSSKAKEYLEKCLSLSSTMCSSCGLKQPKFNLKCSKCLSAYYCNIICQKNHWKNGHKQECKEP